jgi:1-acyl-sn-glycerol-3-phosphate acyltransferase
MSSKHFLLKKARQGLRVGRFGLNLLAGGTFIKACHSMPRISKIDSRHLNDYALFRLWVEDLVRSTNVIMSVHGEPPLEHGLFVSNHISWLDTIMLNNVKPLSFIARHDLIGWPFIGTFTQRMHSVFVDRTNKFQAYRSIPRIEERLLEGRSVVVFPESTTSDGRDVLPFYPMFYEAAVRTKLPVQPVAILYFDERGNRITEPAFIDDDSFIDTLMRLYAVNKVHAELHFLEALDSTKMGRKELCARSAEQIAARVRLE